MTEVREIVDESKKQTCESLLNSSKKEPVSKTSVLDSNESKQVKTNSVKTKLLKDVEEEERQYIYQELYKSLLSDDDNDDDNHDEDNGNHESKEQIIDRSIIQNVKEADCNNTPEVKSKCGDKEEKQNEIKLQLEKDLEFKESNTSNCNKGSNTCNDAKAYNNKLISEEITQKKCDMESEQESSKKEINKIIASMRRINEIPMMKKAELCGKTMQILSEKQNTNVIKHFVWTSMAMLILPIITLFITKSFVAPWWNIDHTTCSGVSAVGVTIIIAIYYILHTIAEERTQKTECKTAQNKVT